MGRGAYDMTNLPKPRPKPNPQPPNSQKGISNEIKWDEEEKESDTENNGGRRALLGWKLKGSEKSMA